ncbi:hypothetical protein Moror_3098 [Moniliophthora roreri MCA 2997]|uniref:Uncharacterized protein n=1 Tax=Moniliophthora roreri (strain MCA 2997) TaxID=1381753 RepID=V2X7Z2_MONRO|nr:hypothetical protein Moror_3098 [Moniliophthora roreri MCA 2997]
MYNHNPLQASQSIHVAQIPTLCRDSGFLCVSYSGPDAYEAFRLEFLKFKRVKSVNVAQLLGFNDTEFPALIFYEGKCTVKLTEKQGCFSIKLVALIPLAHVLDRHKQSPLLRLYFSCQWDLFDHSVLSKDSVDSGIDLRLLWVQPRTGRLCVGPSGPEIRDQFMLAALPSPVVEVCKSADPLPIQAYKDRDVVQYFSRAISDEDFIDWFFTKAHLNVIHSDVTEEEAQLLSLSDGTIHSGCQNRIIARCKEASRFCTWKLTYIHVSPCEIEETRVHMVDGSIRFTVTSSERFRICFGYEFGDYRIIGTLLRSWLSQAPRVFKHLHMPADYARHCSMTRKVYLFLDGKGPEFASQRNPWFLFVRPFPSTSNSQPDFAAWIRGELHHWSLAASGQMPVPEQLLGLSIAKPKIIVFSYSWDDIIYDSASRIQEFKGFNPDTTDFARSLQLPTFQAMDCPAGDFLRTDMKIEVLDCIDEEIMDVDNCELYMDVD